MVVFVLTRNTYVKCLRLLCDSRNLAGWTPSSKPCLTPFSTPREHRDDSDHAATPDQPDDARHDAAKLPTAESRFLLRHSDRTACQAAMQLCSLRRFALAPSLSQQAVSLSINATRWSGRSLLECSCRPFAIVQHRWAAFNSCQLRIVDGRRH